MATAAGKGVSGTFRKAFQALSRIAIAFTESMPMTTEEITAREDQLLDQIAECKRLLAAYQLLRADCDQTRRRAGPGARRIAS